MNDEEKINKQPITIKLNKNDHLEIGTDNLKNFGYFCSLKNLSRVGN